MSPTATTPTVLRFSVPISPVGKARARVFRNAKTGKSHAVTPQTTVAADEAIAWAYRGAHPGRTPHVGPVYLSVVAVCSIPKSWPKWQRVAAELGLYPHLTTPDFDNITKLVADSLCAVAYTEDSHITSGGTAKVYGTRPRIDVVMSLTQTPTRDSLMEIPSFVEAMRS